MTKPPPAPSPNAPKAEHKKHAEIFLKLEEFKKVPAGYKPTDEAKP